MFGWVCVGGVVAAALVAAGLTVGAGSWLSGAPPRPVGLRLSAAALLAAAGVVSGGSVLAVVAWQQGWVGPWFPFALEASPGYAGVAAIRFCPDEGEPLGDRVALDAQGIATVRGPLPPPGDHHRFEVFRGDDAPISAGLQRTVASAGCDWMLVWVEGDAPWTGADGDPARYAAIAREEGITFDAAARRLPHRLVVPDGYRGDLAIVWCDPAPPAGDPLRVDATGVVRVAPPSTMDGQVDPAPFPVREATGAPLVARMTRFHWDDATGCQQLEVRVDEVAPDVTSVSPAPISQRIEGAKARGVPYATVSPAP